MGSRTLRLRLPGKTHKLVTATLAWLLLTLLLPLPRLLAQSQLTITGQVTDSLQAPVPGVSIYIATRTSPAGLAYAVSDVRGAFQLTFTPPADTLSINLRMLGSRPITRFFPVAGRTRLELNFVLQPQTTLIKEVVVQGRPGIGYNDTTTYAARQFTDGTQTNLEDILKNIPGFSVSPEGKIAYRGRDISGIYVEGENLTGSDYQRIARNLDASLVEKIQPIERFVENKLLGGLVRSETTVLNITIPADRKKFLFGNASVEAGPPVYRSVSANVFSYQKRNKLYFIGAHNNIGLDQDPVAEALTNPGGVSLKVAIRPVRALLPDPVLAAPGFRPDLSNLNNETTGGLINVFKPAEQWKLLTDISVYTNRQRQTLDKYTRFLLSPDDTLFLALREINGVQKQTTSTRLRNNFYAVLGEKANFTYENRLNIVHSDTDNKLNLETQSSGAEFAENIRQSLRHRPVQFGQNLLLTNRLNETAALQTQVTHTYDYVPQFLDVSSDSPRRMAAYSRGPEASQLRQSARSSQTALSAETEYFKTAAIINYSAVLGADYSTTTIRTGLTPKTADVMQGEPIFANLLTLRQTRFYGNIKFDKTIGKINFSGVVGLNDLVYSLSDSTQSTQNFIYPTANLTGLYYISKKSSVSLFYAFAKNFSAPEELIRFPLLTDYRSFVRGSEQLLTQPEHTVGLRFAYTDNAALTEFHASARFSRRSTDFGQRIILNEFFTNSTAFIGPATQNAAVQLKASKFIVPLSLRVDFQSNNSYVETFTAINGPELRANSLFLFRQTVRLGTAFDFPVNIFIGGTFINNTFRNQIAGAENVASGNNRVQADYQLVFQRKRLIASLKMDQLFINRDNYLFVDADARYTPTKGKFAYFLTIKNLLGTNTFEQVLFTDLVTSTTSYSLLPRLVMPGVSCRF